MENKVVKVPVYFKGNNTNALIAKVTSSLCISNNAIQSVIEKLRKFIDDSSGLASFACTESIVSVKGVSDSIANKLVDVINEFFKKYNDDGIVFVPEFIQADKSTSSIDYLWLNKEVLTSPVEGNASFIRYVPYPSMGIGYRSPRKLLLGHVDTGLFPSWIADLVSDNDCIKMEWLASTDGLLLKVPSGINHDELDEIIVSTYRISMAEYCTNPIIELSTFMDSISLKERFSSFSRSLGMAIRSGVHSPDVNKESLDELISIKKTVEEFLS